MNMPPNPGRDQKPKSPESGSATTSPSGRPLPKGAVTMPGMSPTGPAVVRSPSGPGAASLAAQLKSRLEERRRSKEGPEVATGGGVPDNIAADIQQAVRVANENGKNVCCAEWLSLSTPHGAHGVSDWLKNKVTHLRRHIRYACGTFPRYFCCNSVCNDDHYRNRVLKLLREPPPRKELNNLTFDA